MRIEWDCDIFWTMSESDREFEPKEFNRADCVRHTARTYAPSPFPLGQRIETRYFVADDVYIGPDKQFERLHSLDAAVAQRMNQLGDPGVKLTNKRLQELDEQEEQARRAWGPTVVSHARKFGLVETLTPEQAKARLALAPYVNLEESVDQEHGDFSFKRWEVFPTKGDNKPMLLVPTKSEEGQVSFETVNLDDLHSRSPEFLPRLIRGCEEKYAMHDLANSVTYNLKLHEVSESELLPEFMREVAKITDPEQRAREVRSMQAFMNRIVRLRDDYHTVYSLNQRLFMGKVDMGDGRSAYIQNYLRHMAKCPTQTKETHKRSEGLEEVYNALLSVNYHVTPFDQQTENPVMRVLHEPARYIVYLERAEERNIVDREQDRKVIDFIAKTGDITDRTQLLEALQQKLPDFHATLVKFKEWLGTDYFEKSRFDELILRTAKKIFSGDEKFDLNQLNEALGKELSSAACLARGKFEGVSVDYTRINEGASLYNPHLKAVLPLLAIKTAQAEAAEAIEKKGDRFMGEYYNRQVESAERLTRGLAQSYRERIEEINAALQDIAENKKAVALLKAQTGITDEEIAHLIDLTKGADSDDDSGPRLDSHLYTGLFNALVLEKQGVVNMHSPAFKGLLKSLFPGKPDTVWQNL